MHLAVWSRRAFIEDDFSERREWRISMNEREELHAQFFASEAVLVSSMTFEQLDNHILELEKILLEGRARASAAVEEKKKRVRKMSDDEKDKLVTRPNLSGTEALNSVTKRKDRMTKMDKLQETLAALGLNVDEVKSITGTVKVNESSQGSLAAKEEIKAKLELIAKPETSSSSSLPILSVDFSEAKTESVEAEIEAAKDVQESSFDPSKLFE